MDECRECGSELPDESNFCQQCGAPQNQAAAQALHRHVKRKADELAETGEAGADGVAADDGGLLERLGYALGWILVVAGFAALPNPAGGFFIFGGVVALPPVRRLLGSQLAHPPQMAQMLLVSLTSSAIGLGVFVLT